MKNANDTVDHKDQGHTTGSAEKRSSSRIAKVFRNLFSTPARCHMVCSSLALVLVALTAWIWINPEKLSADHLHTPLMIGDAITLISNGDRLQNRFNAANERRKENQEHIEEISRWLPAERSWEDVRTKLQAMASKSDVKLITLDRGNSHTGKRISVLDSRCEIQGRYIDVCNFLELINNAETPIWCDEIRVVRNNQASRFENLRGNASNSVICLATLSLRIPYAGTDTPAAKLLQRRSTHAT